MSDHSLTLSSPFPQPVGCRTSDIELEQFTALEERGQCIPPDVQPSAAGAGTMGRSTTLFRTDPQQLFKNISPQVREDLKTVFKNISPANRELLLDALEDIKENKNAQELYETLVVYLNKEAVNCETSNTFNALSNAIVLFGRAVDEINAQHDPAIKNMLCETLSSAVKMTGFTPDHLEQYLAFTRHLLNHRMNDKKAKALALGALQRCLNSVEWWARNEPETHCPADMKDFFVTFGQLIFMTANTDDIEYSRAAYSTLNVLFETGKYRLSDLPLFINLFGNLALHREPEKRRMYMNMLCFLSRKMDRTLLAKFNRFVSDGFYASPDALWIQSLPPKLLNMLADELMRDNGVMISGRSCDVFNKAVKDPGLRQKFMESLLMLFEGDKEGYERNRAVHSIIKKILVERRVSKSEIEQFHYLAQIISSEHEDMTVLSDLLSLLADDKSGRYSRLGYGLGELIKEIKAEPNGSLRSELILDLCHSVINMNQKIFDDIRDQLKTCLDFEDAQKKRMCFKALLKLSSSSPSNVSHRLLQQHVMKVYDDIDKVLKIEDKRTRDDVFAVYLTLLENQDYTKYAKGRKDFSWSMGLIDVMTKHGQTGEFLNTIDMLARETDVSTLPLDMILAFLKTLPQTVKSETRRRQILAKFGQFAGSGHLSESNVQLFATIFTKLAGSGNFDEAALEALTALLNNPKYNGALGYKVSRIFGVANGLCEKSSDINQCWRNYKALADFFSRKDISGKLLDGAYKTIQKDKGREEFVKWLPYYETLDAENETNVAYGARILGEENMFKLMKKRNIRFFNRFEPEDLERQMYQVDKNYVPKFITREELEASSKKPVLLIIFNQDDWNGAFYYNGIDTLSEKFNVVVYETNSKKRLVGIAKETANEFGKPKHLVLEFHGWGKGFLLGKKAISGNELTVKDKEIFREMKEYVDNPTVVMSSCSTGENEESVGAMIADELDSTRTFAPKRDFVSPTYFIKMDVAGEPYIDDVWYLVTTKNTFDRDGKIIKTVSK